MSGPVSHHYAALILASVCSIWPKFSNGDNNRGRPGERRRWVLPVDRVSCMLLQASQLHLPAFPSVHPHSGSPCLSSVSPGAPLSLAESPFACLSSSHSHHLLLRGFVAPTYLNSASGRSCEKCNRSLSHKVATVRQSCLLSLDNNILLTFMLPQSQQRGWAHAVFLLHTVRPADY